MALQNLSSLLHKNDCRGSSADSFTVLGSSSRCASDDPLFVQNSLRLPPVHSVNRRQTTVIRLSSVIHVADLFLEESILPRLHLFPAFRVRHQPDLERLHNVFVVAEESRVATLNPLVEKVEVVNKFPISADELATIVSLGDRKRLEPDGVSSPDHAG